MSRNEANPSYPGWRVAAAGGISVFFGSLFVYSFGIFLRPLAAEFSWSRESISAAYGIAAIAAAAAALPLGWMFDRFHPLRIVVPCQILAAGAFFSFATLSANLWHLYAIFAVLGVAGTAMSALAYSRVISSWFDDRRGMALAIIVCGGAAGGLLHPPLADAIVGAVGWRLAAVIFSILFLLVGVPAVAAWVREPAGAADAPRARIDRSILADGLSSRVFWFQVVVLFTAAVAQNAALIHVVPLLNDRGLTSSQAALAMSGMGAASLFGRIVTGWLLDRFFAPYVSVALLLVAALGTFLLSGANSMAMGTVAAVCIGFGMGGESDVTPYLLSRYFGLRALSSLYGVTWTATGIGAALGSTLMGRAYDTTGSYETLLVTLSIATAAVTMLMFGMPAYRVAGAKAREVSEPMIT